MITDLTYFALKFGNTEDYFIYVIYGILLFLYFNTSVFIFEMLLSHSWCSPLKLKQVWHA